MAEETTILEAGNVTITTRRIVIGNQMFPVAGVTSVRMDQEAPKLGKPVFIALVGAFIALGNAVLGTILILGAIGWPFIAKQPYRINLTTAAGEVTAVSTDNQAEAETILGAITRALTA